MAIHHIFSISQAPIAALHRILSTERALMFYVLSIIYAFKRALLWPYFYHGALAALHLETVALCCSIKTSRHWNKPQKRASDQNYTKEGQL